MEQHYNEYLFTKTGVAYVGSLWDESIAVEECCIVQIGKCWQFVGSKIPVELAYSKINGEAPTKEEVEQILTSCLPALEKKRMGIINRCFATEEEAISARKKLQGENIDYPAR